MIASSLDMPGKELVDSLLEKMNYPGEKPGEPGIWESFFPNRPLPSFGKEHGCLKSTFPGMTTN